MSRINYTITLLALLACLAFPVVSSGDVFFYDDYDAPGDTNWTCADGVRSGYTGQSGCPSPSSYGDVTHYAGEISPGGRTGNSLKMWRRNGIWAGNSGYYGYLDKALSSQEFNNHYKELYIRWYIKIPPEWDVTSYTKLNRIYYGSSAGSLSKEWYINIEHPTSNTWKNASIRMYIGSTGQSYYSTQTISQMGLNDGNWHSLEFRLKLNTVTGGTDGGFNMWMDGKLIGFTNYSGQTVNTNALNTGASTSDYFTSTLPPAIGNMNGAWNFPTNGWYAIEFDDYAVGASYIGPSDYEPTCEDTPGLCESQNDCESAGWFWCDGACQTTPCQVEDTTPPSVTITTSAQTVSTSSVSISFTASDNIGVTSRKWRIGAAPDALNGTACISPATVTGLSLGANTVYIGATDAAGNWGSDSITVNYSPVATTISIINSGIRGGGGVR